MVYTVVILFQHCGKTVKGVGLQYGASKQVY
jgi:hypothetical protein